MTPRILRGLATAAGAVAVLVGAHWSQPLRAQDAANPFIGTVRYFAFNFAPRGWAHCDGQLLPISQNDALFALIGTTYGGDGRTTFALPDMRGRFPVHQGNAPGLSQRPIGQKGGVEEVTLTGNQIGHGHTLQAHTGSGNQSSPTGHALAQDGRERNYSDQAPDVQMHTGSVGLTGGGQSHENVSPFLGVYCNIALVGLFPSRN